MIKLIAKGEAKGKDFGFEHFRALALENANIKFKGNLEF